MWTDKNKLYRIIKNSPDKSLLIPLRIEVSMIKTNCN